MFGICSYKNDFCADNCIYKNKNIVIWDSSAIFCNREGCFLAYTGNINNIRKLKEEKNIKDNSNEDILMTLFLDMGTDFILLLEGFFVVVIYDEINKNLHIFTDKNCSKTVYLAKTESGFLFSDKASDILSNKDFPLKMDMNCLLNIFALPYAYMGEPFCDLYKISGDEYITISENRAEFFEIERKIESIQPSEFKCSFPVAGDSFINCLLSQGKVSMLLPPHIVASAISNKSISNSHLFFMQKCDSYPDLMNDRLDFNSFVRSYCCNLLSNLSSFEYKTEKDIEATEEFFIDYNLYYKPCLTEVFSLCEAYNIKNSSDLLNPSCLKWLFLNKRGKLPFLNSNSLYLSQDIRKTTSELCKNHKEPIFKIINRHKLYVACADAEESFLLFVQRMNNFLKKFRPDLKFF